MKVPANIVARPLPSTRPARRRVFFSFHYDDVFIANQIRQSWRFAPVQQQREDFGFFDGSLWESKKRTSDDSLKSLIRDGMANTSVTVVLAGEQTWSRRWVRYEIARSLVKGNGLLTVKMDEMNFNQSRRSLPGPNPMDNMGLYMRNGGIAIAEWRDNDWKAYTDYTQSISLPTGWIAPTSNSVVSLANYIRTYNYRAENGSTNFSTWVLEAANDARL